MRIALSHHRKSTRNGRPVRPRDLGTGLGVFSISLGLLLTGPVSATESEEVSVGVATSVIGNSGQETTDSETAESPHLLEAVLAEGKALFRGLCSGCHGGAGRGGKGPDLTDDRWIHGNTDADIERIIRNGVPRTTMKKLGESLKEEQIAKVIAYVRSLARAPGESTWRPYMNGDPQIGRELFFDPKAKIQCSKCHTIDRRGGRVGPALDRIASRRSGHYIMESILEPSKDIDPQYEVVQVITAEGKVITGLRVNENNFSFQLREENGRFHSLLKRDLEEYRVLETSLMPENHSEQLTVKQLHDLFAFLMTLE